MEITEVKVRLAEDSTERLRGFCTITFDREFVVRDIKIIEGTRGLFVAMPSRKVTDHCPRCRGKNHLRAKYCSDCGQLLPGNRAPDPNEGSSKLHVDVAHPINSECRNRIQKAILAAYDQEMRHARGGRRDSASEESHPLREKTEADSPPLEEPDDDPSPPNDDEGNTFGAGIL